MAETIVQYAACELEVSVPMLGIQAADHVLAACQQKQAFARVTKASVRARVAELQANAAVNTVVTIERLTAELEEARQLAIARGSGTPIECIFPVFVHDVQDHGVRRSPDKKHRPIAAGFLIQT